MITIKGIPTFITFSGTGKTLLCLHGWDASHESFTELREAMKDDPVRIIAPDLPGFGKTGDPPHAWSVDDYVDFIEALVHELHISNALLLGHSFGGRICIKLVARGYDNQKNRSADSRVRTTEEQIHISQCFSHLYLCASAGLRQPRYWKRTLIIRITKIGKAVLSIPPFTIFEKLARKVLYKMLGVHDYEKASGVNKDTMVKVINEDLSSYLEKISIPTDLFWGEDDTMTPIQDGRFMNTKIVQSKLHTYPHVRHNVHRYCAKENAAVIRLQL